MILKNIIKNTLTVFCTAMLCSIQNYAQSVCELGARNNLLQNDKKNEYSGLAYHVEREIFIMPLDDPIENIAESNIHFKGYSLNDGGFNIALPDSNFQVTKKDFEGLTYLENDYFLLLEEKENKVYFLKYTISGSGNPYFEVLSGCKTGISQSRGSDNGLEGISYDPLTESLFLVRKESEAQLFRMPIELPKPGFPGGIINDQVSETTFPQNTDTSEENDVKPSGLFHLGKIYPSSNDLSNNLLVVDDESENILEYKVSLDSNNNLLINLVEVIDIPKEPKAEGIAVHNNTLYIASEKRAGGLSGYQINPGAVLCNTDCNLGEIEVWNTENCTCEPASNTGCMDSNACNFDASATIDDCSCVYTKSTCDDGNANTINDRIDENCNCKGIPKCQCKHVN